MDGIEFTMWLRTKTHTWELYFGLINEGASMTFTKAKGDAVIKFLDEIKRRKKERDHTHR